MYAAFPLNGFDHNSNGIFGNFRSKIFQIIEFCINKSGNHRTETLLDGCIRLSGCCHGTKSPAMESMFCRDDLILFRPKMISSVFPCHLDHAFIGFCARVLIKNFIHSDGVTDFLCQQSLRDCIGIIKSVENIICLIFDGSHYFFISVSGAVYGHTSVEIQVGISFFIIQIHPLSAFGNEIKPWICLHHIFSYDCLQFFSCQSSIFQFHI